MNRYITGIIIGPTGDETSWSTDGMTVIDSDKTPVKTGLVDASGTPIYRVPETVALGFHGKARR